ncbi:MAG: DUF2752 domain-containing protein [Gemmataceae bacterium]|nr:DUF2752 domain-containing protein [Gemmataceae bacterium]
MSTEDEAVELEPYEADEDSVDEAKPIHRWIRAALIALTIPWIIVFVIATQLYPYEDGEPLRMGTHQQLGLPECTFKAKAGIPCPSCGMTTSFSLLIHADVWNSLKANFAGTGLATFGLLFIPWALASAFFGRFVFVRSLEMLVFRLAIVFLVILFGRWAVVVLVELLSS